MRQRLPRGEDGHTLGRKEGAERGGEVLGLPGRRRHREQRRRKGAGLCLLRECGDEKGARPVVEGDVDQPRPTHLTQHSRDIRGRTPCLEDGGQGGRESAHEEGSQRDRTARRPELSARTGCVASVARRGPRPKSTTTTATRPGRRSPAADRGGRQGETVVQTPRSPAVCRPPGSRHTSAPRPAPPEPLRIGWTRRPARLRGAAAGRLWGTASTNRSTPQAGSHRYAPIHLGKSGIARSKPSVRASGAALGAPRIRVTDSPAPTRRLLSGRRRETRRRG